MVPDWLRDVVLRVATTNVNSRINIDNVSIPGTALIQPSVHAHQGTWVLEKFGRSAKFATMDG